MGVIDHAVPEFSIVMGSSTIDIGIIDCHFLTMTSKSID